MKDNQVQTVPVAKEAASPSPQQSVSPAMVNFVMEAGLLYNTQPLIFDALQDLIEYANHGSHEATDSIDALSLGFSKDFGGGYNVGKALESLSRYTSKNRRVSMLEEDLFKAIFNLLDEQARRKEFSQD